jgi:hypothetical protein
MFRFQLKQSLVFRNLREEFYATRNVCAMNRCSQIRHVTGYRLDDHCSIPVRDRISFLLHSVHTGSRLTLSKVTGTWS